MSASKVAQGIGVNRRQLLLAAGAAFLVPHTAMAVRHPDGGPEEILEPDLPIVDAHHHLLTFTDIQLDALERKRDAIAEPAIAAIMRRQPHYLFREYLADIGSGHRVQVSIYLEALAMYRDSGPEHLKSVGEVEFANGAAAMSASGAFGPARICAGIVGHVDHAMGDKVEEVLSAHLLAGGSRYRGVRSPIAYDPHPAMPGDASRANIMSDPAFRRGFARLQGLGLSFDANVLEPQLPDLVALARSFPETTIILNHLGVPVGVGPYAGQREARYPIWLKNMRELAGCPNVVVKLGGLGVPYGGFPSFMAEHPFTSRMLAAEWRPYIEPVVEIFGTDRCMFETNWPIDSSVGSYATVWNAFKRISSRASVYEKYRLYSETARTIYRLP